MELQRRWGVLNNFVKDEERLYINNNIARAKDFMCSSWLLKQNLYVRVIKVCIKYSDV